MHREGRFESLSREAEDDGWGDFDLPVAARRTTVHADASRTVISRNQSPDIPFNQSINPYRGCEHGCIYCYARPTHAYLGLSPGLDFETKLFAKPDAARLLSDEINHVDYRCETIAMGTNTDPYQPVERQMKVTRGIIEVLARHRHPLTITTKSGIIERDIDLLADMAADNLVSVYISITTLNNELARCMVKAAHVMSMVRATRGGRDNDPNFGARMRGQGEVAHLIRQRFNIAVKRLGLNRGLPKVDATRFRPARGAQTSLL